jgi:hypothetical protein
MSCPSLDELLLAFEAPDGHAPVLRHLDTHCESCTRRWQLLERLSTALRSGPLPVVEPDLHRVALGIPAQEQQGRFGAIGEWVATLQFDSRTVPHALALRGASPSSLHFLFRAGSYDLDLVLLETSSLVGQVISTDPASGELEEAVCILSGDQGERQEPLQSAGDFCFQGVQAGRYELRIDSPKVRLLVLDLDLGEPQPSD